MFPASQQVLTRPLAVEGEAAIPQVISTMQVCTMRDVLTTPAPAYMLCLCAVSIRWHGNSVAAGLQAPVGKRD